MARFEISEEEAGIINTLNNIIKSYGTLLNEEQANKIYKYYRDAYFEKLSRDYTEDDKKRAKDTIEQQLKFLENESFSSKKYKIKLIDKIEFNTWLSWIFGKVILSFEKDNLKIKTLNNFIKCYFIKTNLDKVIRNTDFKQSQ